MFDGYIQTNMTSDSHRFFDILDCWHKTEFFIPFALSSVTERLGDNQTACYISRKVPIAPTDVPLPPNTIFSGGDLYLGTFDKDDVQKIVARLGGETEFEILDRMERQEDVSPDAGEPVAANTCFARIGLGPSGEPLLQSLEVSTLPWAIGHALNGNLTDLSWQAFENGKVRLAEQLFNFEMSRRTEYRVKSDDEPVPLRAADLEPLLNVFCSWANYWPSDKLPLALIRIRYQEPKATASEDVKQTDCSDNIASTDDNDSNFSPDAVQSAEDEADDGRPPEIGILNSFYLTDLELAMKQTAAGNLPHALRDYLTPLADEDRIDIGSEAGRSQIIEMLQPDRMNLGRWPTDPSHSMSLMQQFSINAAFRRLENGGVFSVNGPPGTGKTTLLRDVIAENMVRRARVLAGFKRAEQAFVSRTRITIGDESFNIGKLHPDLTGYEIVVASSNNTAVENISKDLPKAGSVFLTEGETFRYLQPVAHKLAAEWVDKKSGKICFKALDDQEMPWGLIACALGNSKNRKIFRDRALGASLSASARPLGPSGNRLCTLWQWRSRQEKVDVRKAFADARAAFQVAEEKVLRCQNELQTFADLHLEVVEGRLERRINDLEQQARAAKTDLDTLDHCISETQASIAVKEGELSELKELQGQIDRLRPSFFAALFQRSSKRKYEADTRENADAQIRVRTEIAHLKRFLSAELSPKQKETESRLATFDSELDATNSELQARDFRLSEFGRVFPKAVPLDKLADIDTPDLQRSGLWHDETFNRLRSDLFKVAMRLHEAWLAAVANPKSLQYYQTMQALVALLENHRPEDASHCLSLWQNFFMIVPVVSTTFASFSRQFGGLGKATLGWVLIDEAGQAVPQAAVGAMFRAKRALVIGDPLQIEPVLPIAQPLIKALCDLSDHTRDGFFSPGSTSVQVLSDAANIFGEILESDDKDMWVGSPLRVHRRCLDPMFSVANAIAYNDKMVHGLPEPHPGQEKFPVLKPSCWIDLGGKVSGKQAVPEQIRFASAMVVDCYKRTGSLPHLYLISPFREIKAALIKELNSEVTWARQDTGKPKKMSEWLHARVGTVHTFQGKEEDTVVMILGADGDHAGAARWAASKPNILNVAITRSKRRFYVIGDKKLWGGFRYFKEAAAALPTMVPSEFMV